MESDVCSVMVSVVITCFNYGHFLEGCLQSVLMQTFQDLEIIVIDDASSDNTSEVMQSYLNLPNLRYVRQTVNTGQARSKNRGVELSRGQFVAFLDADDLWVKDKLEKQLKLFTQPEIGVVYSRARLINADGEVGHVGDWGPYLQPRSRQVTNWLFFDNFVWFSSSIVRKSCFDFSGIFDVNLSMGIDWDLWLRISVRYEFLFVDEPLLLYRMGHAGQMSKNIEGRQQCSDRIRERFLKDYPEAVDQDTIWKAYYLTFYNRGNYFRFIDFRKSCRFFIRAICTIPFNKEAYVWVIKSLFGCKPC